MTERKDSRLNHCKNFDNLKLYMMLVHESRAFEMQSKTKFEVCGPRNFFQRYLCSNEEGLKNSIPIHDFHESASYSTSIPFINGLIIGLHNDQPPAALIAQLVKHCTGIAKVRVRIPLRPQFFRPSSRGSHT